MLEQLKKQDFGQPANVRSGVAPSLHHLGFNQLYRGPQGFNFANTGKMNAAWQSLENGMYRTVVEFENAARRTVGDIAFLEQWFVMVTDRQERYPGHPLRGDNRGWALYKPDAPNRNVATDYMADCLGCHQPARATDLIYRHAYPTLTAVA